MAMDVAVPTVEMPLSEITSSIEPGELSFEGIPDDPGALEVISDVLNEKAMNAIQGLDPEKGQEILGQFEVELAGFLGDGLDSEGGRIALETTPVIGPLTTPTEFVDIDGSGTKGEDHGVIDTSEELPIAEKQEDLDLSEEDVDLGSEEEPEEIFDDINGEETLGQPGEVPMEMLNSTSGEQTPGQFEEEPEETYDTIDEAGTQGQGAEDILEPDAIFDKGKWWEIGEDGKFSDEFKNTFESEYSEYEEQPGFNAFKEKIFDDAFYEKLRGIYESFSQERQEEFYTLLLEILEKLGLDEDEIGQNNENTPKFDAEKFLVRTGIFIAFKLMDEVAKELQEDELLAPIAEIFQSIGKNGQQVVSHLSGGTGNLERDLNKDISMLMKSLFTPKQSSSQSAPN